MKVHAFVLVIGCALVAAACDNFVEDSASITGPNVEEIAPRRALSGGQWSVEMIRVGAAHACALEADGEAYCWGNNAFGQLGDGTVADRNVPTLVVGSHEFVQLDALEQHTCAVTADGEAYCWGDNRDGQLGDGTTTNRREPTRVAGGHTFTAISTDGSKTCALDEEGAAWCWGDNIDGQLGNGSFVDSHVPTRVSGGRTFASIESVGRTCALEADGTAYCWGWNGDRQVAHPTPTRIPGAVRFLTLVATVNTACGVGTDGLAYCWGGFDPDFEVPLRTEPTVVQPDHGFLAVSDDGGHCGLDTVGDIHCWDWSTFELTSVSSGNELSSFSGSAHVSADGEVVVDNICVLDGGGFAYCWGDNDSGQLGDGSNTDRDAPTPVATPRSSPGDPQGVRDLAVADRTARTITLTWTQVDDGTGNPARYRVRYGSDLTVWRNGEIGCDRTIEGDEIGARIFCVVDGLEVDTRYEFKLMSFRTEDGAWVDARYSNLAVGETASLVVDDLTVGARTAGGSTLVRWTQVDDGTGNPAWYRVRHASEIDNWKDATIGCERTIRGENIGFEYQCSFPSSGYDDSSTFEVQLMSFRVVNGVWRDAHYSNIAVAPAR